MRSTVLLSGCIMMLLALPAVAPGVEADAARKGVPREGNAGETDEVLRQILREAIRAVTYAGAVDLNAEEKGPAFEIPSMRMRMLEQPRAEALLAIGTAQAMVGDLQAARKTWQDANDRISSLTSFDIHEVRPKLLLRLADGQFEAGERDEALATLQQASQSIRMIKSRREFPVPAHLHQDPQESQAAAYRQVAAAQAKAGDARAARKSFEQALEAAGAIKDEIYRVEALVEIAKADVAGGGREAWTRATDLALSLKEDFRKSKSIEAVLRGLVDSGGEKDAVRLVSERLDGDARAYGIWAVADALAEREGAIPPDVVGQVAGLAEPARFDLPSKQMTVLTQVARAQAKAHDDDGAYRTIGRFLPQNAQQRTELIVAKFRIMKAIAKVQIRSGKNDEARGTLQAALEAIAPFQDENGGTTHHAAEILPLFARAGASATALRVAGEIRNATRRADVLMEIAVAQAESGERDAAVKTLELARRAIDEIANESLWTNAAATMRGFSRSPVTRFRLGHAFDLGLKHTAMENLAVGMAKAGDVTRALEVADALAAEEGSMAMYRSIEAFEGIAQVQIKAGDFAGAVKTADHIRGSNASYFDNQLIEILKNIAEAQAKSGDAKGVLAWGTERTAPKAKLAVFQAMADGIVARKSPRKDKEAADANTP